MIYDAVIIGGGVIGLSILHTSLLSNYNTLLIERNQDLCNGASGRNSGILCTGVDAPSGSLERALIRDSISRVREFCIQYNVPFRECGSLVCLWPWDVNENEVNYDEVDDEKKIDGIMSGEDVSTSRSSQDRLQHVLHESHIAGDTNAKFISSQAISKLEPSISEQCLGAIHIPGETVVDPWLFPLTFAVHSREIAKYRNSNNSGRSSEDVICTGREVMMELSSFDKKRGIWNIVTRRSASSDTDEDTTITIQARCIINAAGIDSDLVQLSASAASENGNGSSSKQILPQPKFEARPRRGQYAIFAAPVDETSTNCQINDGSNNIPRTIPTRPIQPVPSQFTKGIFVYSTLYDQIVVGPTAQDQISRTDNTLDSNVRKELISHASRVLGPQFDKSKLIGEYVGIRPGTTKRDYQIQLHHASNFITVGGIRSTGLTASLGIGRHVVQCLLPSIDPRPELFDDHGEHSSSILPPPTPLPDINQLVEQYHKRGDGKVSIGGHLYKVSHPLTKLGWDARCQASGLEENNTFHRAKD